MEGGRSPRDRVVGATGSESGLASLGFRWLESTGFRRVLAAQRLSDHLNSEGVEYYQVFRIANQSTDLKR